MVSAPTHAFAKEKTAAAEKDPASGEKETKKNTTVVTLDAQVAAAHAAALQALASIGCEVKKDAADSIEGKRANKMGLAVGSGGEKLFITIKDLGQGKTEITVVTKKTMVGIVGQKLWNEEVAAKIREILSK